MSIWTELSILVTGRRTGNMALALNAGQTMQGLKAITRMA